MTYLSVDRKCRIPTVWWYNLADAVLASFWTNLAHVFHRIAELFLCRTESRRVGKPKQTVCLWSLSGLKPLSSPRNGGHVQWFSSSRAEWDGMVIP